ncbi:MAG: methyltransferase domain-containing protein [Candidatus Sabulitectum sp.]|nr:methyltransferase domain-containing protein [Candidatus Sabulitectum sp.]
MQSVLIPETEIVLSQFSDAAGSYDSYAEHHRLIASKLLDVAGRVKPDSLLELGCGTGILSAGLNLLFPEAYKEFTDGATEMVRFCQGKIPSSELVSHSVLDFEKIGGDSRYDLVLSSCALQWLRNPASFTSRLPSLLKPGGYTVHAIPVKGMLGELEQSFVETEGTWNSLNYISGGEWDGLFQEAGFRIEDSFSCDFTVIYKSPVESLRAVRGIGASLSSHRDASVVSPGVLRKALNYYSCKFGDETGAVPVTYKVHFVVATGGHL